MERTSGSRFVTIDSVSSRTRLPTNLLFRVVLFGFPGEREEGQERTRGQDRYVYYADSWSFEQHLQKVKQSRKADALWRAESIVRTSDRGIILPFVSTRRDLQLYFACRQDERSTSEAEDGSEGVAACSVKYLTIRAIRYPLPCFIG